MDSLSLVSTNDEVLQDNRIIPLSSGAEVILGRQMLVLGSALVSRKQIRVTVLGTTVLVEQLGANCSAIYSEKKGFIKTGKDQMHRLMPGNKLFLGDNEASPFWVFKAPEGQVLKRKRSEIIDLSDDGPQKQKKTKTSDEPIETETAPKTILDDDSDTDPINSQDITLSIPDAMLIDVTADIKKETEDDLITINPDATLTPTHQIKLPAPALVTQIDIQDDEPMPDAPAPKVTSPPKPVVPRSDSIVIPDIMIDLNSPTTFVPSAPPLDITPTKQQINIHDSETESFDEDPVTILSNSLGKTPPKVAVADGAPAAPKPDLAEQIHTLKEIFPDFPAAILEEALQHAAGGVEEVTQKILDGVITDRQNVVVAVETAKKSEEDQRRLDEAIELIRQEAADKLQALEDEKNRLAEQLRLKDRTHDAAIVDYPQYWVDQAEDCKLYDVDPNTLEYEGVVSRFADTVQSTVVKLQRVQNKRLWKWYYLRKAEIAQSTGNHQEKLLFHGSSMDALTTILKEGLDTRVANLGGAIGAGIYFAEDAVTSTGYVKASADVYNKAGNCHQMLLCRVALGAVTQGAHGLRRPPQNYDSVHGNLSGRKMYAIFDNNQSYPEYLISYTGHGGMLGGVLGPLGAAISGAGFSFGTSPAMKTTPAKPGGYYSGPSPSGWKKYPGPPGGY